MSDPIPNNPDELGALGKKLNDMTPEEVLDDAHWAHRLIDAIWDGEFDCPICGRMTNNGTCTGCMRGTSPLLVAQKALAEAMKRIEVLEVALEAWGKR